MSRSSLHKEKHRLRSVLFQDNCNEETSARTRPFSFDEIMLRRKNKKQSGGVEAVPGEAGNISVKDIEKISHRSVSGTGSRNNYEFVPVIKHVSEDFLKVSSSKREGNTTLTGDKLVNRKDRESRDSVTKSKATLNKYVSDKTKGGKHDRWGHGRRKDDEWSSGNSEYESGKRHAKNLAGKDRYADRSRGKTEKESKRKQRNEDDERSRERNAVKKHDSGKWYDSETSERKEWKESSEIHYEGSRPKKRRSMSRERDKDRGRRSVSLSPRAHNHTSYNVRELGELSSHSSKDRSRRQQSDNDRTRISNNGPSDHYQRHAGSTSKLGGYSPRKRRTEAAVKTPSPPHLSPEKTGAGRNLPPAGADSNVTGSVISNVQSSNQTASSNMYQISSVAPVSSKTVKALSGVFSYVTVDSIQLTQATRPMRRLYVENLPASASEKDLIECLNNFLLPSGVNHVQGSLPCISCTIHKEKGQALVEFLTPEDASAALSFDGRTFSGSILKIRRPKDFVKVATGVPDKSVAAVDSISDIVVDSPQKIFIGGISKAISPEMLMEIVSAFGPLKACHFKVNMDLNEPCAFLEYVDQSVTLKACAGLNGMSLGGQMLTVVLATPDASSVENIQNSPFYGIPEHAKALLEKPTQVLKLRNVLDPEGLSLLSEEEMEEILDDTRLECARFGTVKSMNVVKCSDPHTNPKTCEVYENPNSASDGQDLNCKDVNMETETCEEHIDNDSEGIRRSKPPNNAETAIEVDKADGICGDTLTDELIEDEICNPSPSNSKVAIENPTSEDYSMALEEPNCEDNYNAFSLELPEILKSKDQIECCDDKVDDTIRTTDAEMEHKPVEANGQLPDSLAEISYGARMESDDALEKGENGERVVGFEDVFEPGCVLVEYRRTEAACTAAHSLHGRFFDNRTVTVGYIDYNSYKARFLK